MERHRGTTVFTVICCLLTPWANAPAQDHHWSVLVKGSLTTSSQLYPNPDSPDPAVGSQSLELGSAFGYSAEVRYLFPDIRLAIGLSLEYLRVESDQSFSTESGMVIPLADGYRAFPLELTGYFIIPFSGPTVGLYIGGGGGLYFGHRMLSEAGMASTSESTPPGAGIHVLAGVSVVPHDGVSLTWEMKFRDLQFSAVNSYATPQALYQGVVVPLVQSQRAEVHTDGIVFQIGVAVSL